MRPAAGPDALEQHGASTRGTILLAGGGARSAAFRQTVADLTGREVVVPDTDELVACGAAAQAATVLHGCGIDELADAWDLRAGHVVEPDLTIDRVAVREAYARALASAANRGP
jgi:xylulokinase